MSSPGRTWRVPAFAGYAIAATMALATPPLASAQTAPKAGSDAAAQAAIKAAEEEAASGTWPGAPPSTPGLQAEARGDLVLAMKLLKASADKGDVESAYHVGRLYNQGAGVPEDPAQAAVWYRKAIALGSTDAKADLGIMYVLGRGVPRDPQQGLALLESVSTVATAAASNLCAIYTQGVPGVPSDLDKAVTLCRAGAALGAPVAQLLLGELYEYGPAKYRKDSGSVIIWYMAAAERGSSAAQVRLGIMFANGRGVPKDHEKADAWYRKAAAQGSAEAEVELGYAYWRGLGVPSDLDRARAWYLKAADKSSNPAYRWLGDAYEKGLGVKADPVEAFKWRRKSADRGDAWSQEKVAFAYADAVGTAKDEVQALVWIRLADAHDPPLKTHVDGFDKLKARVLYDLSGPQIATADRLAKAWKPVCVGPGGCQ